MYVLLVLFFGAGYALGKFQHEREEQAGLRAFVAEDLGEDFELRRQDQFGHLELVLRTLHRRRGQTLDTAQMDALLQLEDVASEETKRSRRARMVSDVNGWAWSEMDKPVLTRTRDDEDRRRTLYVVGDFHLPSWVSSDLA